MNDLKYIAEFNGLKFIIEEDDPDIGFYMYVFKNEVCIKDYLQDTLEIVKDCAFEDYGVSIDSWKILD